MDSRNNLRDLIDEYIRAETDNYLHTNEEEWGVWRDSAVINSINCFLLQFVCYISRVERSMNRIDFCLIFLKLYFPQFQKQIVTNNISRDELDGRGKVWSEYSCCISRARMKKYIQDRKRKQDLWGVQEKRMDKRPKQVMVSSKSGGKVKNEESLTGSISSVHSEHLNRMSIHNLGYLVADEWCWRNSK